MWPSDHLDMVGVGLYAKWRKTMAANGDEIYWRISVKINNWMNGKFMNLTQRGWFINCYALFKAWFKFGSVNQREKQCDQILVIY